MSPRRFTAMLTSAMALTGCAVGPNFQAPAPPMSNRYSADETVDAIAGVRLGAATPAQWWKAFGSPELDALVEEALKANPDLKSADAALRQAREDLAAHKGALFPGVDASDQAQRAKTSDALSPVLADNSDLYSLHTAELDVSYGLDVFGGTRRAVEAAAAQAEAQRFQYEAARQTLIANVISGAVQEAALRRQVEAAGGQAKAARDILDFTRLQAAAGGLGQADIAAQETTVAQADQAVPPLKKALAQQRTALMVLLGREAGGAAFAGLDLDRVSLPAGLPVALPAQLVRQRPDIRAAEASLHAASAGVGVAIAARLPTLTLSASAGGSSPGLQSLFSPGNDFWTLTGGAAQPIFQGGALLHRQKAAEAAFDQAKAQYRSTVLNALKNVADSLDAIARDAEALNSTVAADTAAQRSLQFSRRQLELGEIGALAERGAEQAAWQARSARAAAVAARYADTAALFQALGGGWNAKP